MTEDQIQSMCNQLSDAFRNGSQELIASIAMDLLAGFLTDVNRIAWFLQEISEKQRP